MLQRVALLKEKAKFPPENFNACQITSSIQPLQKSDPFSIFTPVEISFFYGENEITKLINSRGQEGRELDHLYLNCLEYNNFVYLFIDTLKYESQLKFGLNDLSYVIYSTDNGQTWSDLIGLDYLSKKTKFVIPHEKFFSHVRVFGNKENHVFSLYNIRDETTYLLDPNFNILKTVSVYNRLSGFELPEDFYYHDGTIYLMRGSCELRGQTVVCPGVTYRETSQDFGQTWEKTVIPYLKASRFITYNQSLYNIYLTPCSSKWWKIIPAFNKTNICGELKVSKLQDNGTWSQPTVLTRRVNRLIDVYQDDNPIAVWQDLRFHKFRNCGLIPLVGCIDSGAFKGPDVTYAGEIDMDALTQKEHLIKYKENVEYFK